MSAQTEMRNVIEHAAAKLQRVQQREISESNYNHGYALPADTLMAMSYARGVLDLLATYLKIDEAPTRNGHAKSGRPPSAPRDEHGRYRSSGAAPARLES
jgi:hypothetical protein